MTFAKRALLTFKAKVVAGIDVGESHASKVLLYRVPFCGIDIPDLETVYAYLKESENVRRLSNYGPCYRKLCSRLQDYWDVTSDRRVVVCSSATTGLIAIYNVLGVKRLLIPDYTFEATRCAATIQSIPVEIVDVTFDGTINLRLAKKDSFDAVCAVAPLSVIPNLEYLKNFCIAYNKHLILDFASTFGTPGIRNYGIQCVSFHATKVLALGEGGAIVCDHDIAEKIEEFLNFGFDKFNRPVRDCINGKVSEYTCAIGLSLLDTIESNLIRRKEVRNIYRNKLAQFTPKSFVDETVYQPFPIFLPTQHIRDKCAQALKEFGVEAKQYYEPLVGYPVAKHLYATNLCLPCHHQMTLNDADGISKVILDHTGLIGPRPTCGSMIGIRHGHWKVIGHKPAKDRNGCWESLCECGNTFAQNKRKNLKRANTSCNKSCSLVEASKRHFSGVGFLSKTVYEAFKQQAKRRNIEFSISMEYLWDLFVKQRGRCALTGLPIEIRASNRKGLLNTASLDRIDSKLGYIPGNVQWVHKAINVLKHTFTNNELIKICKLISKRNTDSNVSENEVLNILNKHRQPACKDR